MLSPRGSPTYSLTVSVSLRPQQRFTVVVCLLSSLPHLKYGICSFFDDLHGRLDLELVPKLFYFSTVQRVSAFVVLLPPSTTDVACARLVHTDETWRFRTMSRFSIVSFPPRPMRLVTKWMISALSLLVFLEELPRFLLLLGFPCSLAYLPFVVGPFLLLVGLLPTTAVAALKPQPLGITASQPLLLSMVPYCRPLASH